MESEVKDKKTIGVDTSDIVVLDSSNNVANTKITYRIESPRNVSSITPYEKGDYSKNSKLELGHNICIILNYLIISTSLVLITLFIYDLINKLDVIDINRVINIFGNINNKFDNVNGIINKVDVIDFDRAINIFGNISENFDSSTDVLVYFKNFINSFEGLDKEQIERIINQINGTLFNINNKLNYLDTQYSINTISNINNFRPAYDETIQEYASTTTSDTETSSDIVDIKPDQPNPTQIPEPPRFP